MKCKLSLVGLLFLILELNAQSDPQMNRFIDDLIARMTLEEKLGQLNLPTSGDITTGQAKSSNVAKKIQEGKVGGLFNIKGVQKIREVQKIAVEKSRLGIPLIFGMDVIHGYETTFPIPLGLSCSWDTDLIKKTARVAAQEATADGINWTFSPMVDLSRDPRWGRIAEGSGEDTFLNSEISKAMVQGYQGNDISANNTLMACVKHFALYGAPEGGRDYNTVDMSLVRMYNEYFPPYKSAVEAGAGTVMTAFNEVNGVPASGNHWLFTEVLRNQWGFDGFVVTDYEAIKEMIMHGVGDLQQVSIMALKAGVDMDMVDEAYLSTMEKSLQEGKITIDEIDTAVKRILKAKYQLGLFEDPYKYCDENRAADEVFNQQNRDFARKVAAETFVLMKNEDQILPIQPSQKIALVGPLADAVNNMPGTWAVAARHSESVSLKMAFDEYLDEYILAQGSNVDYDKDMFHLYTYHGKKPFWDDRDPEIIIREAVEKSKDADIIVAAVGETSEMSGESSSRTNIRIPQAQKDLLNALYATGKPVVLVLFTGRPLDISEEEEKATAILNVWYPGTEAGNAIYDVLFGQVNPSGKLTTSFPRNIGQIPIYYNHKNTGRPKKPENQENCKFEKFKTAYLDTCNTPLFPFGFGLSYTTFSYSDFKLSSEKMTMNGSLTASVTIKNTGDYDGSEVAQLYLRDRVGSITRPVKELKGFKKIFLKKGEAKTVSFTIGAEDLKYYNSKLEFGVEPGEFDIAISPSSDFNFQHSFSLIP